MSSIDTGNTAWVLASTALVMIMTPGVGFYYAGVGGKKNVLSVMMGTLLCLAVVSVQWFIWGYSLSFSTSGGEFIGDLKWGGLDGVVDGNPHPAAASIPHVVFMLFQCVFATVTAAIAFGGGMERVRLVPFCVFIFAWTTVVYDVIAYWTWGPDGWLRNLGGLDYAGGTPVHIASGFSGFVFAYFIGHRKSPSNPHNITYVVLGTALLWFGWFGFNGGSAVGANARAGNAALVTNFTAAWTGIVWVVVEYFDTKKISALGFCEGAVAGLVAVTPGSGFVEVPSCLAIGFVAGVVCYYATKIKTLLNVDDVADTLAAHGIGGVVGNILTGVFSSKKIIQLDGTCTDTDDIPLCQSGGWVEDNFIQVPIQMAGTFAAIGWSVVVTYILLFVIDKIPGLQFALDPESQEKGGDYVELGEAGYDFHDSTGRDNSESNSDGKLSPMIKLGDANNLTRAEFHAFDNVKLVAWFHGAGLHEAARKAEADQLIGADVLEAPLPRIADYFGESSGPVAQKIAELRP